MIYGISSARFLSASSGLFGHPLVGLFAFRTYGDVALWSLSPVEHPTPGAALAITSALRTHGSMEGGDWPNASSSYAVPLRL